MGRVPSLGFSCSLATGPWKQVKILLPQFPHLLNEGFGGNYCQISSLKMESSHSVSLGNPMAPSLPEISLWGTPVSSDHSGPTESQAGR